MRLLSYCTVRMVLLKITSASHCADPFKVNDESSLLQLSASVRRSFAGVASNDLNSAKKTGLSPLVMANANPVVVWVDSSKPTPATDEKESHAAPTPPIEEETEQGPPEEEETNAQQSQTQSTTAIMPEDETAPVPKRIHFMYKTDLDQPDLVWPNPVWKVSFEAWRRHFPEPEYEYSFWTDDAIDVFFKQECPEQYDRFSAFAQEIYRSDLSRYCILKALGGIYSDLDYEPRTNFYISLLPGKVSLIESPYGTEEFQNSLMASPIGSKFSAYWTGLLNSFENTQQDSIWPDQTTGPGLLESFTQSLNDGGSTVVKLPCKDFQHKIHQDGQPIKEGCDYLRLGDAVKGIHWGTVSWLQGQQLNEELVGQVASSDTVSTFQEFHPDVAM